MMSIVLYLRQISRPQIKLIVENKNESVMAFSQDENLAHEDSAQLTIIEPFGSIFFASLEHIGDEIDAINEKGNYTILMVCNAVNHIDMAGAEYLYSKSLQLKKNGGALYLCGLNPITYNYLAEAGYIEKIGKENVFSTKEIGLKEINNKHKKSPLDQKRPL